MIEEEEYNSGNWKASSFRRLLAGGCVFRSQIVDGATDGFSFDAAWPADGADQTSEASTIAVRVVASPNAIGTIEYPVDMTIALDASTGEEQDG